MQHSYMKSFSVAALLLVILTTGCIKEDLDDCPPKGVTFTVKAYDNDGKELTREEAGDVVMFIFDGEKRFLEKVDTKIGENITVIPPTEGGIHVVAWSNLAGGHQKVPQPLPGTPMDECGITLLPAPQGGDYRLSPDDLFRGDIHLPAGETTGTHTLPIYRETGQMDITIRNLKEFAGYNDDNYTVVVRETSSGIDFRGNLYGDKVAYRPEGTFVTNGSAEEFTIPPFNLFPSQQITIEIYHSDELIVAVSKDASQTPVSVQKGLATHVLIELKTLLSVSVSISPWGEDAVWKEF